METSWEKNKHSSLQLLRPDAAEMNAFAFLPGGREYGTMGKHTTPHIPCQAPAKRRREEVPAV